VDSRAHVTPELALTRARAWARRGALAALAVAAMLLLPAAANAATVSGLALENLSTAAGNQWTSCDGATANVKLVRDGGAQSLTTSCDPITGAYSFGGVNLAGAGGSVIAVYLAPGGSEQGVSYTRSVTTSNIANLDVSDDRIRIRTESVAAGPFTTTYIDAWDNSNDPAIPAISDGTELSVTASQRIGINIESGTTFQPNGTVTVDKVRIQGTWSAGATTLLVTGTGSSGCGAGSSASGQNVFCINGGSFSAGSGIVRFTLANGGAHSDVNGPITFNTVQIWPAVSGNDICIANSGTVTMTSLDVGSAGRSVEANSYGTLVADTVTINDGATIAGSGWVEVHDSITSTGTGNVDDWNLRLRMRPAGGVATFGSTSGGGLW
jgi:hypothetical protein